ncbi:amidohydrolase family protein [Rubrivirga sp.]|uniref:amidohydrolase family protein n=1 Tax=Rubrivirga sp. TaxID=1885344 RepID=UPI003C773CFF
MPFLRAFLLSLFLSASAVAQPTALVGATVYDGTGAVLEDAALVVEDGQITCVGECRVPAGAETADLGGRFVTPGLVDAHVHYGQTGWLDGRPDSGVGTDVYDYDQLQTDLEADPDRWHRAYLCSGVTAVFDPGGMPWTIDVGDEERTDRPHVRSAGPLLTHFEPVFSILAANGENTFLPMQTDDEAVASVRQLAERGADAIKVWYLNPQPDQRAALDARLMRIGAEARAHGLPLIVHATELVNAKVALRAGASMLVHSVEDAPVDDEFVRLAGAARTVYAPTLGVGRNWRRALASVGLGAVPVLDDPNSCVDAETRRVIAGAPALSSGMSPEAVFAMFVDAGREEAMMAANLARVHAAGIPVVAATDAGNPLTLHGPSIYAELEAMEAAGLSPTDVLEAATRNGAAMMGELDRLGTLEVGKLADLIVLTEDPGASSSAFRSLTHVMRGGVLRAVSELRAD